MLFAGLAPLVILSFWSAMRMYSSIRSDSKISDLKSNADIVAINVGAYDVSKCTLSLVNTTWRSVPTPYKLARIPPVVDKHMIALTQRNRALSWKGRQFTAGAPSGGKVGSKWHGSSLNSLVGPSPGSCDSGNATTGSGCVPCWCRWTTW